MAASLCVTVLAAGKGTRMRNALPKVLHPLAGRTLIEHVLASAAELAPDRTVLVLGAGHGGGRGGGRPLAAGAGDRHPGAAARHRPRAARWRAAPCPRAGTVLVLFGDTPLLTGATLARLIAAREAADAAVAVLGMRPRDPAGYGRLRLEGDRLVEIVEDRDADRGAEARRPVQFRRHGVRRGAAARAARRAAAAAGDKGEYYLTDAVALAVARGWRCVAVEGPAEEGLGVNSQAQLAEAAAILQRRLRRAAARRGRDPAGTGHACSSAPTPRSAPGAVIEPYVVFGPGVRIGAGAVIHSFSHLERATVADRAEIGPFARLRPGSDIGEGAKIGNFVETKNTRLEPGAKASHLSYLGDATVGAGGQHRRRHDHLQL